GGWEAVREPREAVDVDAGVDLRLEAPTRRGVAHCEHERVAAAAEVKARLLLDDHRQERIELERRRPEQLAAERTDRQLGRELRRPRPAADDEHAAVELTRAAALLDAHAELG